MTKYCTNCGEKLSDRAKYCSECGVEQATDHSINIGRDFTGEMNVAGRDIYRIGENSERIPCPTCHGSGLFTICDVCKGKGYSISFDFTRAGRKIETEELCVVCKGAGKIWTTRYTKNVGATIPCESCNGLGWIRS